jgi:hypothetical protein
MATSNRPVRILPEGFSGVQELCLRLLDPEKTSSKNPNAIWFRLAARKPFFLAPQLNRLVPSLLPGLS